MKGLLPVFGPRGLRIVELSRWDLMPERRAALGAEDEIHPEEAISEKLSLSPASPPPGGCGM